MAQIPSTPAPTTTTPAERRKTSPSKPTPSAPKKTASKASGKKVDDGPLPEARKAAVEGANEVKKAMDAQPTPERAVVVGAFKVGEAAVKTAAAGAKEIGTKVAEGAKAAGEKVAEAAKPIIEPFTREIKEAKEEISEAAGKYGSGWVDSLNPFDRDNVREAWESAPTPERAVVYAGVEALKNVGSDTWNNVKNLGNLGREVLEGAGGVILHNPVNNAVREGVKGAVELGKAGVDVARDGVAAAGSWISDRISGGADGAVEAGKTASDTSKRIADRTKAQNEENAREIGEAVDNFSDNYQYDVSGAWNGQPTPERAVVAAGWNILSTTVKGNVETVVDTGILAKEVAEAGVQNVITGVQNTGDAIAGGIEAAGDFVGGLFGR